jgi:hypothetical protein
LVGNDEICIYGHFCEAIIFKMAANKIVKLSMVSDFNENWYLGVFWSEELVSNDEPCIHMPKFWYGGRFRTSVFASNHNQTSLLLLLLLLLFLFFFSPWTCPTKFSETDDPIFTKLHRKVDPHLKKCHHVLEFSKWPPLPWKPWTYVKVFEFTYIGNCQRDFHKTCHIY